MTEQFLVGVRHDFTAEQEHDVYEFVLEVMYISDISLNVFEHSVIEWQFGHFVLFVDDIYHQHYGCDLVYVFEMHQWVIHFLVVLHQVLNAFEFAIFR